MLIQKGANAVKFCRLVHDYMKGIRLSLTVLSLLYIWALLSSMLMYGQIQYINSDLELIEGGDTHNAGVLFYFPSEEEMKSRSFERKLIKAEAALEADPLVKNIFCIRSVNPVTYNNQSISIVLYEPGMLALFPNHPGATLSRQPNGVLLASTLFADLDIGDQAELTVGTGSLTVTVAERMYSPYRHLSLSQSSSLPTAQMMVSQGSVLIMEADDAMSTHLTQIGASFYYGQNLIAVFDARATQEEIQQCVGSMAPGFLWKSFDEIIANTEQEVSAVLKSELPRPLFLTLTAFMAYFSILILTLKRKERSTAVCHLCGMSKRKAVLISTAACQTAALIPSLFAVAVAFIWPHLDWTLIGINLRSTGISDNLLHYILNLNTRFKFNASCIAVIVFYYVISLVLCGAVSFFYLRRHTPKSYLRGVQ